MQIPSNIIVVHNQHGLEPPDVDGKRSRRGRQGSGMCREIHAEFRAFARNAFKPDMTPGLLHQTIRHGQPDPRAFRTLFGGEKWFEDLSLMLKVDTTSGIAHFHSDVLTRRQIHELTGARLTEPEIREA